MMENAPTAGPVECLVRLPLTIEEVEAEERRQAEEWATMTAEQRNEQAAAMDRITRRLEQRMGVTIDAPADYW